MSLGSDINATVHNFETMLSGQSTFNEFIAGEGALIEADIAKLQAKLREARVRQNAVFTRIESAQNRVRMREAYAGSKAEQAFSNFALLEREADYAEGQAEALALAAPKSLEEEIAELKVADRVEAELAAMKARKEAA